MRKYVIGLDFGTLSGRAVLTAVDNGEAIASCVMDYPHAIVQNFLPDGVTPLERDCNLQIPQDYIDVITHIVPDVMAKSGVAKEDVIAIAIDCTASTLIPIDAQGRPLCEREEFAARPHAYIKLWKHHAAQPEADEINEKLNHFENPVQEFYGKRISSEIVLPKVLEILRDDPEIYETAAAILEIPDWLNYLLTGQRRQSINTAGYKTMYFESKGGYPTKEFLRQIDPGLENFVEEKLSSSICRIDEPFGRLNGEWAEKLHLAEGTAVGCSIIDAHACMIGCGITEPGRMMLVLGTSSVQSVLCNDTFSGNGIIGTVKDCVVPGYYCWETGLAAVGDQLSWYAANCTGVEACTSPEELSRRMIELTNEAGKLAPGESKLIALDWWNGNKTPFVRGDLPGVLVGLRLDTTAAMIFRALIESTAYGTRVILERFEKEGAQVNEIIACGGIATKNPVMMQIFADVLGREIRIAACKETGAMGAAIIAATAAGSGAGGYDSLGDAAKHMTSLLPQRYLPNAENKRVYDRLFAQYLELSAFFGERGPVV